MSIQEGQLADLETLDARQFAIAIRKLATSLSYGIDRSPFLGAGTEFVQSRPYQPGDPVRAIDWRVTARTRRYHVKEYEAPKNVPCVLVLDTSASMAVSSTPRSKYALSVFVAGGIALAALDRASPVGVVGVGERVLRVQPTLSRARALEWLLRLRRYRFDERTTLAPRLAELGPMLPQRALVVILSDLHDEGAGPALKKLAQVHDCVVLQLVDPAELGLGGGGFVRAREAETGIEFVTRGKRARIEPEHVAQTCRSAGIDHLLVRTDAPFEVGLRRLFKNRGFAARGTR